MTVAPCAPRSVSFVTTEPDDTALMDGDHCLHDCVVVVTQHSREHKIAKLKLSESLAFDYRFGPDVVNQCRLSEGDVSFTCK